MKMARQGIRIGLHGAGGAVVDPFGVVFPDGWRGSSCGWWLAASDKWHDPRTSPSVRQQRVNGTPVVQTKVAVPGGDVVQRVFVVADQGGRLVMHVSNESPEPVVVAVPTRGMSSTAAAGATRPQGIETPDDVRAFPLSHRASITFAWPLVTSRWRKAASIDAGLLPSHDQVARGWVLTSERASRVVPEGAALVTARGDVSLMTPDEIDDLLDRDPAVGTLTIAERIRMGDNPREWTSQIADAARRIAKQPQRSPWSSRALMMAARTLVAADESLAADDVVGLWQRVELDGRSLVGDVASRAAVERAAGIEQRFVRAITRTSAGVLPMGIPDAWRGANVEAHGVVATPDHRVSLALRWHGENVALLWEVDGPPGLHLSAPSVDGSFSTVAPQGEALLRVAS
jgi:hypothetical protein